MQRTIHKFELHPIGSNKSVDLPKGGKVISFHIDQGIPCIWVEFKVQNIDKPVDKEVKREFFVCGSGITFDAKYKYISTTHDGDYTWHLFEKK
jgi:hypothetical protein